VSAWAFSGFNIALDAPATPTLTATQDLANGKITLTGQARDNLLTLNQSSLETDTTGWAAGANTTITRSGTQFEDGAFSLQLSSTASGNTSATTPTGASGVAVLPSTAYIALADFRTAVSVRACKVAIFWYKANGAASDIRASDTSATVNDSTSAWTQASMAVTSPSDAAFAALVVTVVSNGAGSELHYVDQISLAPGTSTTWSRGGLLTTTYMLFEYSDDSGTTWKTLRNYGSVTIPSTQSVTAYDYELKPTASRQYRCSVFTP